MISQSLMQYFNTKTEKKNWGTIVIGGGQAGLAAGYYLKKAGEDFLILDTSERVGDSWRQRWDSLKLFSPAEFNALPGWPYPGGTAERMTKDQMADYLEQYAEKFSLPVRSGISVTKLSKIPSGFEIDSVEGNFTCKNVVVATGTHQVPRIPGFSAQLNSNIVQIHSSGYRNPEKLPPGDILVVGSAVSGIEIALELSKSRYTMIAGAPSFVLPRVLQRLGKFFYWWFINNILTIKTPIGRKARPGIIKGGAVVPQMVEALENAKLERLPRIAGANYGSPMLEDGRLIPASTIIWCTGYQPNFSWIHINDIIAETGWPVNRRGVSPVVKGLYFVGMPFQFGLTSGLVGGVGRDAAYVVNHIFKNSVESGKI
jgi:putative flavoprotein involved in K+ transport